MREEPPNETRHAPERWHVYMRSGLKNLEAGKHAEAARQFSAAYRLAPDRPEVCLALGREYQRRGQVDEAEALLRKAFDGNPMLAVAAAALARLYGITRGEIGTARAILAEGRRWRGDHPLFHVVEGELFLEEGDYAAARRAFEKARERGADERAVRAGLARTFNAEGMALADAGSDEQAIFAFKRAADLAPDWAGPHVNMGVAFARLGKLRRARRCYEKAIGIEPDNPVAFFNLGEALRALGDRPGAIESYERVLEVAPDYPGIREVLATMLADDGNYARAVELYREALESGEERASTWERLGVLLVAAGDEEQGERCLRRAMELDPQDFSACCNLAALCACQGRMHEAERLARRACSIDERRGRQWLAAAGWSRQTSGCRTSGGRMKSASRKDGQDPTNTNG